MKSKNKIKESEKKLPFCPHCKTIIKEYIIRERVYYSDCDLKETNISFDDEGMSSIDESDWDRQGDGEIEETELYVLCGNCNEDITDLVEDTIDNRLYVDDSGNINKIRKFFRKGNKTPDEIMVELL